MIPTTRQGKPGFCSGAAAQNVERPALRYRSRLGMADRQDSTATSGLAAAWAVHLLTGSGVVLALLALAALEDGDQREALLWLVAAIVIDGVDGTLARAAHVKTRLPRIDGEALDLVIDYLTYVFIPAVMIWRGEYLPEALALPLTALVLISSLYVFARRDMKTEDGYFRGFPALWIGVAFFFLVLRPSETVAAVTVALLVVATFAPIHVIHPFRARDYGIWPIVLTAVGAAATAALLLPGWHRDIQAFLAAMAAGTGAALIVLGLLRTYRGPTRAQ